MNPFEILEMMGSAERLGLVITEELMHALQDSGGDIQTKHTYAIGFAVGAAYRTVLGDRLQGAETEVAPVLAEAFQKGWNLDALVKGLHQRMTEKYGPKPWGPV